MTYYLIAFFCGCTDDNSDSTEPIDTVPTRIEWTQIIGDGFGHTDQDTVPEFEVFKGYLYAATAPTGPGMAKLHRTATGNADDWEEVTPDLAGDKSIHSFGTTDSGDGYIWFGTGSPSNGGTIFRSEDGETWTQISHRGFGNALLTGAAPHMVVYQGSDDDEPYLYAGMGSHGAGEEAQVWRTPFGSTNKDDWEPLVDFAEDDDHDVTIITYFYVWEDTLYFGTDGDGQIWQSTDGSTFEEMPGMEPGFGDSDNFVISSLVEFNGSFYATTTNHKTGGELWFTEDGSEWDSITTDAFGKGPAVNELRSLRTSFDKIWLTAYTQTDLSDGTAVWCSEDGLTFEQSNTDGFGDPNNNGQNAVTIGFGDYQYWGGPNYEDGGQIWRAAIAD